MGRITLTAAKFWLLAAMAIVAVAAAIWNMPVAYAWALENAPTKVWLTALLALLLAMAAWAVFSYFFPPSALVKVNLACGIFASAFVLAAPSIFLASLIIKVQGLPLEVSVEMEDAGHAALTISFIAGALFVACLIVYVVLRSPRYADWAEKRPKVR